MATITITNPPPSIVNRRKCGWGSAITTCSVCGKVMIGHNRGVCSRCMRALGGSTRPLERVIVSKHFGEKAIKRDLANGARVLAFAHSPQAEKPTAEEVTK